MGMSCLWQNPCTLADLPPSSFRWRDYLEAME